MLDDLKYFIEIENVHVNVKNENFETPLIIGKLSKIELFTCHIINSIIFFIIYTRIPRDCVPYSTSTVYFRHLALH